MGEIVRYTCGVCGIEPVKMPGDACEACQEPEAA